jgi:hypothetical protein
LFTQEINDKEKTFGISSSSTLEEDHEARQESRHVMNMTPNGPRTKASTYETPGTQTEDGETWMASLIKLITKETTSRTHMQEGANREKMQEAHP